VRPLFITLITLTSLAGGANAALTVTLHLDTLGNTVVSIVGSGTTGASLTSTLGTTAEEQWINMSGNPFDDTVNLDNLNFTLTDPIALTDAINVLGIQIDNDGTGDDQDDFRLYISSNMNTSSPYSANGVSTLTTPLDNSALNVGTFTDDNDGGTTFLGGFSLVITTDPAPVPEPSSAILIGIGCIGYTLRRSRN
jgi:hypothetical protein